MRFSGVANSRRSSQQEVNIQMNPIYNFKGQVALVTGAAKGMGLATARMFAQSGASVVLADRRRSRRKGGRADRLEGGTAIWERQGYQLPQHSVPLFSIHRSAAAASIGPLPAAKPRKQEARCRPPEQRLRLTRRHQRHKMDWPSLSPRPQSKTVAFARCLHPCLRPLPACVFAPCHVTLAAMHRCLRHRPPCSPRP